ncbi:MAG TPA: hypothetical protein DEP23_11940 [Ruminococcaceae bacterium]|nr:hypothetical protein [Oscillospiraceae bacterium]
MKRYEITCKEWERIKDFFPPERTGKRGRPTKSNRDMFNGTLWIARNGERSGENCRSAMSLGSLPIHDSPNGGMTAFWRKFSVLFLRMPIWRTSALILPVSKCKRWGKNG